MWVPVLSVAALFLGCQNDGTETDKSISAYRDRMLVRHSEEATAAANAPLSLRRDPVAVPTAAQSKLPQRTSLMTQPATTSQPAPAEVLAELPDPAEAPQRLAQRLEDLRQEQAAQPDQRAVWNYERVVKQADEYLTMVVRPQQVRLSLSECIQRAISNNYTIRIEAHNPAISQTQIVEAEAAFDVEFFLDTSWANLDRAVQPHTVSGASDARSIQGGFRKLLPTGAQASIALGDQRSWNDLPRQGGIKTWNPIYTTNLVGTLSQPLLRGFGLDVNRAQIDIRKVGYEVSYEVFIQKVRDTLLDVETAYWQLAQARRTVAILAEAVAQNWVTYQNMIGRTVLDATEIEVANSKSTWESRYVRYLEAIKTVRDAEDQLKNLLNDPELKLSTELEIIPIETPVAAPIAVDHFAEVRTALDRRSEIHQARKQIDATRIGTLVAKNATLPKLDLTFQYEVQGLGNSGDNSWDNFAKNRFISYTLGATFSYNFGERAARAQLRRAKLEESKAVVTLNQVSDTVVTEVNQVIRLLMVRYTQVPPQLDAVRSAERNLTALRAKTPKIDPSYLQTELGAVEQLASTRTTLLQVLTDFNVAIVQLEKAKGTLLDYNNVVVTDAQGNR